MGGESQNDFTAFPDFTDIQKGPYIRVPLIDPIGHPEQFSQIVNNPKLERRILEIGIGTIEPRCSFELPKNYLWLGCDYGIRTPNPDHVSVHIGRPVYPGAKMIVADNKVGEIPSFTPDIICSVAPNPEDIAKREMVNNELKRFLDPHINQDIVIILEVGSEESKYGGVQKAQNEIAKLMKELHFIRREQMPSYIQKILNPSSSYIKNKIIPLCYTSIPQKR